MPGLALVAPSKPRPPQIGQSSTMLIPGLTPEECAQIGGAQRAWQSFMNTPTTASLKPFIKTFLYQQTTVTGVLFTMIMDSALPSTFDPTLLAEAFVRHQTEFSCCMDVSGTSKSIILVTISPVPQQKQSLKPWIIMVGLVTTVVAIVLGLVFVERTGRLF